MGTYNNILNALNTRLSTVSGLPAVKWPNDGQTPEPVQGTNFIRVTWMPANSVLFSLDGKEKHIGLYQIDVFTQLKKGSAPGLLIADSIREHFKAQNSLTSGGDIVHIQAISPSPPQRDDGWWITTLTIQYLCIS